MRVVAALLIAIGLTLPLCALSQTDESPHRVAYVNVPWILDNSPQVDEVESALRASFSSREEELRERQVELERIEDQLRDDSAKLSDDEIKQLERELVSGKRRLKIAQQEFQEDLSLRQSEEISILRRQISEVIKAVAKDMQIDLVFETAVVYVSDRVDISKEVLKRLQSLHQAKGGASQSTGVSN